MTQDSDLASAGRTGVLGTPFSQRDLALLAIVTTMLVPALARATARIGRQGDALDSLERAGGLKSELVATVSHELRTPLTAVLGFTELLMDDTVDATTRRRHLDTIHGEAQRLNGLIDEFLDLQKIEAGHFDLASQDVRLDEIVAQEVDVFGMQSPIHALTLDVPGRPLNIVGDPARISRLVANLLSNAIKYSPDGGTVRVHAVVSGDAVPVSVTDAGIGIARDQQQQVFERFFRVDSSETHAIRGTGLGLALCREIVDAHGGRIGLESSEGEGSTFWFELPASPALVAAT